MAHATAFYLIGAAPAWAAKPGVPNLSYFETAARPEFVPPFPHRPLLIHLKNAGFRLDMLPTLAETIDNYHFE